MASPKICVRRPVRALTPDNRIRIEADQHRQFEHVIRATRRPDIMQSDVPARSFANPAGSGPKNARAPGMATKTTATAPPIVVVVISSRHAGILQRPRPMFGLAGPFRLSER